jgi:plasmid stabilization system protein ParE
MTSRRPKELRWLNDALEDLAQIVAGIAETAPRTAERFAERVFRRAELLQQFPHLGPVCPYHRRTRQLVHGNYVIYYTIHRTEVVVRAVVRGARLFRPEWLRRE